VQQPTKNFIAAEETVLVTLSYHVPHVAPELPLLDFCWLYHPPWGWIYLTEPASKESNYLICC